MIPHSTLLWCELSDWAVQELLLLMSLYDQSGKGSAKEILTNVSHKRYYRRAYSQLAYTLEQRMLSEGYTSKVDNTYQMNKLGQTRLRDLCELTNAMPSRATDLTKEGFIRVRELRSELQIFPFTNGRQIAKGKLIRQTQGYSVYAVLLHEDALGLRYRMIHREHDSCLPCVYVGMTERTPVDRFDQHRFGEKRMRSKYVSAHGLCLMPLLYSSLNINGMSKVEASQMEEHFANSLRECGFAVFAGHLDHSTV